MRVKFFTLLQLWIVIFWREIIELFLKIAQFRIDVIDKARVNICKFLNELFFSHILILTSSQNHIEIYRYLWVKSKNILEINLKMAEAQNDAYSSAFIRKRIKYAPSFKGGTFLSYAVVQCLSLLHSFAK